MKLIKKEIMVLRHFFAQLLVPEAKDEIDRSCSDLLYQFHKER